MQQSREVVILGAGGHALVVASTLIASGQRVAGFYDDRQETWGQTLLGAPVIGPINKGSGRGMCAIIGIGNNQVRKRLAEQLDFEWVTVVHPFAWVHPEVPLGPGTVVCAGAIVQPGAKVGAHVILNTKASVDHDCLVGDYVHIAVAHLAGGASAAEGAFLGLGSTVLPGVVVGAWATVGAGALARKDVRPCTIVVGVPAREITK
jgi:sugar O-acyltransferase (sialic acid O-acetyltransferase NeuD family)